jgi:hypothetical protein
MKCESYGSELSMINQGLMSSKTAMWATPQWLFDSLNSHYQFTLEVCAIPEKAKCKNYFSPEQDGLGQPWKGICWMNPPYGKEYHKAKIEFIRGRLKFGDGKSAAPFPSMIAKHGYCYQDRGTNERDF